MADFSGLLPVVGGAFVDWLKLFGAPLKNLEMLWIIIPILTTWLFSEFFQEKRGTSYGNAISNGAVMLFVGIDWMRYIIRSGSGKLLSADNITEMTVSALIILASIAIIILGIKGKKVVKYIGRVRESTYLMLMFTPIIYDVVDFSLGNIGLVIAFFPLFYLTIEVIDRILPNPKTYEIEKEEFSGKDGLGGLGGIGDFNPPPMGGGYGQEVFGAPQKGTGNPPPMPQQPLRQQKTGKF